MWGMGHGRGGGMCGGTRWAGGWLLQVQRGQTGSSPATGVSAARVRVAPAGLGRLPGRWTVLAKGLELRSFPFPSSPGLEAPWGGLTLSPGGRGAPQWLSCITASR